MKRILGILVLIGLLLAQICVFYIVVTTPVIFPEYIICGFITIAFIGTLLSLIDEIRE